jgi:thiol-disulfide isomerase/thioredoxin
MLRKLPIIIILSLVTQFLFAKSQDEVVIMGQIDDALARTVLFSFKKNPFTGEQASFEAVANEDKQFVTKVKIRQPSVVLMKYQNRAIRLYLTPGDTLKMRFNGTRPLETMLFDGSTNQVALQNTYMQQSLMRFADWVDESFLSNMLYNRTATEYYKYINDIYNRKKDFLDTYAQAKKELFSEAFLDFITSDVEYWRAYHLMKYYDVYGLNNATHPIGDYYFNFIFEMDNMNHKALNNDYYLSYIELFLKYWKEKSKEGQALSNQPDIIEEKTRVERIVKPPFVTTRVLEDPFATEKVISWLSRGEEAVYLNLHTAEKFRYVAQDTSFEDTFYKIQTMDNKIGWVPSSLVNIEEKTRVIRTMRVRNCLDPNSPLCGFDQHLSGKVLYFMVSKDIMFSALNEPEAATEQRIRDFNVNNLYPEFTELLNTVFQNIKADKMSGNNRLRVPDFVDFNYHTMEPHLLTNALYKLKPIASPVETFNQQLADRNQQIAVDKAKQDADKAKADEEKIKQANIESEKKRLEEAEKTSKAIAAKKDEEAEKAKKQQELAAAEAAAALALKKQQDAQAEAKRLADVKAEKEEKEHQVALEISEKKKKESIIQQQKLEAEIVARIKNSKAQWAADSIKAAAIVATTEKEKKEKLAKEAELASIIEVEKKQLEVLRAKAAAEKIEYEEILRKQKTAIADLALQEKKRKEAQKQAEIQAAKIEAERAEADRVAKIAAVKLAAAKAEAEKLETERVEKARIAAIEAEKTRIAVVEADKKRNDTVVKPTPAVQTAPSIAPTSDAIQFAASKPGMEIDNTLPAVALDPTAYKPGETVRFEGMLINEGVPPFSFVDINGKEVRQPDLLGKVIYIDFWATWCAPCKEHIRYMQSAIEENKDKDIVYLFISVDKDPTKWRNYVRENNLGGIHVNDQQGLVSMYWNIQAVPNYFLLGKDGRVAINSFIKSKKSLEDMAKYLLATKYQGLSR